MKKNICLFLFTAIFSLSFSFAQNYSQANSGSSSTRSSSSKYSPYGRAKAQAAVKYDTTKGAFTFKYKYRDGDAYKIHSVVNEDVFFNQTFSHTAEIVNRISVEVGEIKEDGSAKHTCSFVTSENSKGSSQGNTFAWGEDYESIFYRDEQGVYDIEDYYFMPVVRDVPVFPKKELTPGDVWTYNGHEAHDLRRGFNLQTPFKVPFTAVYTYLGTVNKNKKNKKVLSYAAHSVNTVKEKEDDDEDEFLHVFSVKYTLSYESPEIEGQMSYEDYPASTLGFSDQIIYWDNDKGCIDHYSENFRILIETAFGNLFEFRGQASAEVTEFVRTSTADEEAKVREQIAQMGLENVDVKKSDKGLVISIENIQFMADSAILTDSEKTKLNQIALILNEYPENDILVSGHTALAGSVKMRQSLSEERAQAVASYLISLNVRDKYHIFTKGYGATKPLASNNTAQGKAKNRRVEITIMDK